MIQNLGNRIEKIQETFNKELEELKSRAGKEGWEFSSDAVHHFTLCGQGGTH